MTSDTADIPLCVRCSRSQKTCCQVSEVYCGPGDKRRIAAFTGRSDFYRFVIAEGDWAPGDDDPPWRDLAFRADGARRVLARRDDGDCTFLGEAGCALPLEVRPLICRLYPFDYDHAGLRAESGHHCPRPMLRPGQGLLAALDMRREDAERWRAQLYRELPEEADDEDRPDLRPAP